MTREEVKSCIGTIEMLQRLAYNIHGVMDVIDADNCKKIIKALEQEPILNKLKEKDEAKAVRYEGDGYADGAMVYDMAFCPNCEHEFEEDSENWECDFCPNCGQKLRWEV